MKLAIICANGKAGQLITKEALERGHDVTAFVRGENRSAAKKAVVKDLFELTKEDLSGYDAVIDAFGAWTAETLPQHVSSLRRLCDLLSGTETRLLVVGGAGSLYADASRTVRVMDTPAFPDGTAEAQRRALDLREPRRGFSGGRRENGLVPDRRRRTACQQPGREPRELRRLCHRHGE